jgi:hypothetical protein
MKRWMWLTVGLAVFAGGAQADSATEALERIAQQEARIPALRAALTAAEARGLDVSYPRADLLIGELFCRYCRDDAAQGRPDRALDVARDVEGLLDRAAREMEANRGVPRLGPGPITVRDGSFWAECTTASGPEVRPVFLTGYGHFGQVVDDLPVLGKIGINIIQIEQGPAGIVLEEGVDTGPIQSWVIPALDRAKENGVRIALLISPHYFPAWALEKWPELEVGNGFLKNTVEAPQAREIYERFLRTLIPLVKDHPALHSICLTNEPVYIGAPTDPWRKEMWAGYLRERHGEVSVLNKRYAANYGDFGEVPLPLFNFKENKAALYDAVRFNQRHFAGWHRWMVDIIHEMAPELPCHAKVMPLVWNRETVFWGTDPWDFAQLSQLNGNDCYFEPVAKSAPWQSRWQIQNMYYDLQRGMKPVPVINTENHIIPDRFKEHVSPNHIYTAIWQGAVHGQGASTTWAWARTCDAKSDFEGLILHRAACTAAMSRCALDLMRLSREMAALQNAPARAAILYSNAALVHDARCVDERNRLYEALNFCGVPIAFVTEEQAAAGGLAAYDCLLVAGARNVLRDAAEAIRARRAQGGRVIFLGGQNLMLDEYGAPLDKVEPDQVLEGREKGRALRDQLISALAAAGVRPPIDIRDTEGNIPYGVEWRCADLDGALLINVVNLTRDPIVVRLPAGEWQDLIEGATVNAPLELAPNTPYLLRRAAPVPAP